MRRRSNSHSPISLFTFLDTLVCTMGSLILMLLAMTPKIRERAEARDMARLAALAPPPAAVAAPDPDPDPEPPVAAAPPVPVAATPVPDDDAEQRAAERQARHDGWNKSLADAQKALQNKQAEYQRLRLLLKETQTEFKAIQAKLLKVRDKTKSLTDESQELTAKETQLEAQEARIAQKIALTRKNLELANRQQATTANEFALVPYDGASGTTRRPIYIECSRRGFRFVPEDETLNPNDLDGFRDDYNPLLSGAQMLLRYWALRRRESGGKEPVPYVLLLVRPSGIENYLIARAYLSSLDANFGYELIEEDWKLHVPDPDPVAKNMLKQTLDITVAARQKVENSIAGVGPGDRGGWSGDDRGGSGGPRSGGNDPTSGGNLRGGRKPSIKFGPALRTPRDPAGLPQVGEAGDSGDGPSGTGFGSGGPGADDQGLGGLLRGNGGVASRGTGSGGANLSSRPAAISGGGRAGGIGASDASGDGTGDGGLATGIPGLDTGVGTGSGRAAGGNRRGSGNAGPLAALNGDGSTGGAGSGGIGNGSGGATTNPGDSAGPTLDANDAGGSGGSGRRPGRTGARPATLGGSGAASNSGNGDDDGNGGGNGDGSDSLELPPEYTPGRFPDADGRGGNGQFPMRSIPPDGSSAGGGSSYGTYTGASQSRGTGAPNSNGSSSSGAPSSSADAAGNSPDGATGPDSLSGSSASGGSPPGNVQMGGPGMNFRLGGAKNQSSSAKDDDPNAGPRVPDDDAKGGGKRGRSNRPRLWGAVRAKATIGLERKLQIRVLDDRLLIGSKDNVVPLGNGETVQEMIQQTVAGIERAAEKWGDPPTSYYWMPTLRFVIYPGGDQYYERLHSVLETDWGLSSTMEYAPPPAKKATGGAP